MIAVSSMQKAGSRFVAATRSSRRMFSPMAIAQVGPALVVAAVTMTWVRWDRFIASGDVAPYIRDGLGAELGSVWNHQLTGAGSTSYEVVRGIDLALIRLVEQFGGNEMVAQHILIAGCMATCSFGAAFFARTFLSEPLAVAAAGLLAVFNPFLLVLIPNPLFPLAIGLAGVFAGLLLRAGRERPPSPILLAVATMPVAYLAVNPPLLVVLGAWTVGVAVTARMAIGPGATAKAFRMLAIAAPIAIVLALWWVVPTYYALIVGGSGVSVAAQTNVDAWAWSHADNSLANLVTLEAHWGWAHDDVFPFRTYLDGGIWPFLRFVLPVGAVAGAITCRRRSTAALFVTTSLVCLFVAKGLHEPFAGANRWLYENAPGYWLFREPMSKVGVVLVLVYVVLFALALDRVIGMIRTRGKVVARCLGAVSGLLVVAALVAPLPVWNGDVIASDRGILPSSRVEFPDEWREVATAVNASSGAGKTLVLPQNTFYQVSTTWGYHGVDTVISQLLHDPVIQRLPGGYFEATTGFERLVDDAQAALRSGDITTAERALQALGVSHVVVRHDLVSDATFERIDTSALETSVAALTSAQPIHQSDVASVFRFDGGALVRAYGGLVATASGGTDGASVVAALDGNIASTDAPAVPVDGLEWRVGTAASTIELEFAEPGSFEMVTVTGGDQLRVSSVSTSDEGLVFEPRAAIDVVAEGALLGAASTMTMDVEVSSLWALEDLVGRRPIGEVTEIYTSQEHPEVRAWASNGSNLIGDFSGVEDCFRFDGRSPSEAGLRVSDGAGLTRLMARAHSACVWTPIGDFEPGTLHRLTLDHRTTSGLAARLCVWQVGPNTCADLPALVESAEWSTYDTVFTAHTDTTELRLYLYADGADTGLTTITDYRLVDVRSLHVTDEVPIAVDVTRVLEVEGNAPVRLTVAASPEASLLGAFSDVEDCFRFDDRSADDVGLGADVTAGLVRVSAKAHSACVWAPIGALDGGQPHRVTLDHRTTSGLAARLCVWQVGPNTCAELPALDSSREPGEWSTFDATFIAHPDSSELRLYLYGDGADTDVTTIAEYRDASVVPARSAVLRISPGARSAPELVSEARSPSEYEAKIRGASGPFVLVLADSYAPGWLVEGLPEGWSATHIEVDGYANGWRIDGTGDADLTLRYGPQTVVDYAMLASLAGLIALIPIMSIGAWRRHAVPRPHTGADRGSDRAVSAIRRLWRRPTTVSPLIATAGTRCANAARKVPEWWRLMLSSGGGFAFLASLTLANIGNLLFHSIASHRLGAEAYGALGALLAVMLAVSLPAAALQVATTKAAATGNDSHRSATRLMTTIGAGALAVAAAIGVLSPVLASFLHLDSNIPILWTAGYLVPSFVGTVARGVLLADLRFRAVGLSVVSSTAVKVGLGWFLFQGGSSLSTATAVVFFVELLLAVFLAWSARSWLTAGRPALRIGWRDTWSPAAAFSGMWMMLAIDLIFARHFLARHDAGEYVAAATVARAVLFVPQSIALAAHARMVQAGPRQISQILRGALGATAAVSITAIVVVGAAGDRIITSAFGGEFAPPTSLIVLLAVTSGLLAVTNLFVHHRLARGLGVSSVWLGSAFIVAAVAMYHDSPTQIATSAGVGAGAALWMVRPRSVVRSISSIGSSLTAPAPVDVSVVLPVYNSGRAAADQIEDLIETMTRTQYSFEVIVVDDGSTDDTLATLADVAQPPVWIACMNTNRGKGSALRCGVDMARGSRIAFLDADGDIAASHIPRYLDLLDMYGCDAVIGSKRHPESVVSYPPIRRIYSWGYQLLVRVMFRISVRDTQVGAKVFTRETLHDAIPFTNERGFAFDLELLSVAHVVGHRRIVEAPVTIEHQFSSTVSWRSATKMFRSTISMFGRMRNIVGLAPNYPPSENGGSDNGVARPGPLRRLPETAGPILEGASSTTG